MTRILIPRTSSVVESGQTGEGTASIVLPAHLREQMPYRCAVVVDVDGTACGRPFFRDQRRQWERHVVECAREHNAAIRAYLARRHPEVMNPWDKDLASWIAAHRTEILEGRKKI